MPDFPQIVPMLSYEDVGGAADWLGRAFGFEETDRIEYEGEVVHVELRLGRGVLMLGRPGESYVNPKRLREQCEAAAEMYSVPWVVDGVWVQVGDIDEHFAQAKAAAHGSCRTSRTVPVAGSTASRTTRATAGCSRRSSSRAPWPSPGLG